MYLRFLVRFNKKSLLECLKLKSIFTRLICYLWTKGRMKLTKEYALYSTSHPHHRSIGQPKPIPRNKNISEILQF